MKAKQIAAAFTALGATWVVGLITVAGLSPDYGRTTRVSVASDGTEANWASYCASLSLEGRYVAFSSDASNLVDGDTNGRSDIFLHDRETGHTKRVSVSSEGMQSDGTSGGPSISADGMYIAFDSDASNLVSDDSNAAPDIFVFEVNSGEISRVSVSSDGTEANDFSFAPSISADGRFIAFTSYASNLVPDDHNGGTDVFVHDQQTGQTMRVSIASAGAEGNGWSQNASLSADGRFVAFDSSATNLVIGDPNSDSDIFVHDMETGETSCVSLISGTSQPGGNSWSPSISSDGRFVAFESHMPLISQDDNSTEDIYVYDRLTDTLSLESRATPGSLGDDESFEPWISWDGSLVAFSSNATNLVTGDTNLVKDIFIRYRQVGKTIRASVSNDGDQANSGSECASISGNGGDISFSSWASNLVEGDKNGYGDIFINQPGYIEPTPTPTELPPPVSWQEWLPMALWQYR